MPPGELARRTRGRGLTGSGKVWKGGRGLGRGEKSNRGVGRKTRFIGRRGSSGGAMHSQDSGYCHRNRDPLSRLSRSQLGLKTNLSNVEGRSASKISSSLPIACNSHSKTTIVCMDSSSEDDTKSILLFMDDSNQDTQGRSHTHNNVHSNSKDKMNQNSAATSSSSLQNNVINITSTNTSNNLKASIHSADIPNLDFNFEVARSNSDDDSSDGSRTVVFNENKSNSEEYNSATDRCDVEQTQIFEECAISAKYNGTEDPCELQSSQSLLKSVSRQLFSEDTLDDNVTNLRIAKTDRLNMSAEEIGSASDSTHCSLIEEKRESKEVSENSNRAASSSSHREKDQPETLVIQLPERAARESVVREKGTTDGKDDAGANIVGTLDDSEDDDVMTSLVEAAVERYLGGVVDKVRRERSVTPKQQTTPTSPTDQPSNCSRPRSSRLHNHDKSDTPNIGSAPCKGSSKPCVHLHFHINTPSPKKGNGSGQTSILNYFQPTRGTIMPGGGDCNCQESQLPSHRQGVEIKKGIPGGSKRAGVDEWRDVMKKMKQGKMTNIPSVSGSSMLSQDQEGGGSDKQTKQRWGGQGGKRHCPFYKYIPDTNVVVDAFCYGTVPGVTAYFLTHFHYDHYRGLNKSFSQSIYCSYITGRLVAGKVGVKDQYLHLLPMDQPVQVHDFQVTLLDANHCPGAVMFLFKLKNGTATLHVGDFRAHPRMESYPELWNSTINTLFLDTTYCNPVYDFPSQEEVVDACVSLAQQHVADNHKTLIIVGSYTIGKERVFKAIAEALNCRVWAPGDKRRILGLVEDTEITERLTTDKHQARVHVLRMGDLSHKKLMSYVNELQPRYSVVVAFKPTGWEHSASSTLALDSIAPRQVGNVKIYGMPYSEHSSFTELRRFVQFTQPSRIIPTVNVGNPNTRKMMEGHFSDWLRTNLK